MSWARLAENKNRGEDYSLYSFYFLNIETHLPLILLIHFQIFFLLWEWPWACHPWFKGRSSITARPFRVWVLWPIFTYVLSFLYSRLIHEMWNMLCSNELSCPYINVIESISIYALSSVYYMKVNSSRT